jgi:hypothetical protein
MCAGLGFSNMEWHLQTGMATPANRHVLHCMSTCICLLPVHGACDWELADSKAGVTGRVLQRWHALWACPSATRPLQVVGS